jgi:hypothetical protein
MLPKNWIFALLATLLIAAWIVQPAQGSAQPNETASNSCLTCHEDLYYLHDTGKWYCITEHQDRCTNCHEGNPSVLDKDESHLGLIVHPQQNNGEKCLECHPQDTTARLNKFASLGGMKTLNQPAPYEPAQPASLGAPQVTETNKFMESLPWAIGGVVLFVFWLALMLFSPTKP